jgi:uncharacterized membrane protein YkgB
MVKLDKEVREKMMRGGYIYRTPEEKEDQEREAASGRIVKTCYAIFCIAVIIVALILIPPQYYIIAVLWGMLIVFFATMTISFISIKS